MEVKALRGAAHLYANRHAQVHHTTGRETILYAYTHTHGHWSTTVLGVLASISWNRRLSDIEICFLNGFSLMHWTFSVHNISGNNWRQWKQFQNFPIIQHENFPHPLNNYFGIKIILWTAWSIRIANFSNFFFFFLNIINSVLTLSLFFVPWQLLIKATAKKQQ